MTVYIIIVTHNTGRGIVSIDCYQTLKDAQARKGRAELNFPLESGYRVYLFEQWPRPDVDSIFDS